MSDLFDVLSPHARSRLRRAAAPRRVDPMLATLIDTPFSDPDWIYERKLDGLRCLMFRERRGVRLVSRNGRTMNATWPELVEAVAARTDRPFVADGEIVAFRNGRTSFSRLQARIGLRRAEDARASGVAVYLYLFDLLHAEGWDATDLAQRHRKSLLKRALDHGGRVRFTPHRNEHGEALLDEACAKDWEGLIAKDARAPYRPGRSRSWLKLKCVARQELVIGGWTDPRGSREGLGALLVGYYEDGGLRYAGKVGTGFDAETLALLARRLERRRQTRSPFAERVDESGAHFVRPDLVGEFGFTEWTRDGKLRHPRFLGLRSDKSAEDVRREHARRAARAKEASDG